MGTTPMMLKITTKFEPFKRKLKYHRNMRKLSRIKIRTIEDTLERIKNGASVCRFGDGEIYLMLSSDRNSGFQKGSTELTDTLLEVFATQEKNLLICLPDAYMKGEIKKYKRFAKTYWKNHITDQSNLTFIRQDRVYYNSNITRPYMDYKDSDYGRHVFDTWKGIFKDKELLIIEGARTRIGVGNDLLDNADSVQRILIPPRDAFDKTDEIINYTVSNVDKKKLVLVAAGPAAKKIVRDLYRAGYQAIDIGHLDVEYEWFLKRAALKCPIKGKYVNESGGDSKYDFDEAILSGYKAQIIKCFC